MAVLDSIDRKIMRLLQEDAKLNVKEIAIRLNLTKTPIYERIKRLEREGIIDKYVAIVNRKKLAPSILVFISGKLEVSKFEQTEEFYAGIMDLPEVLDCYLMSGEYDFLLKVMVKDLDDYHEFYSKKLSQVPRVSYVSSSFVLNEAKRSTVLPG
ncbi:AsnC family transcriptional regulator [Roseivirga sp. 4D4]|uniref:Lrp/AsnC family transcriptional regulator n=1 Tax=Roseivirga sp. 4D4 TaxID=1889784 RepID=UPI000852E487|nr:Lrp/AsnC family transcriptional regulator [Roseivirga sp. 4D4]OEK01589.1 AsnC family transcriptional regulator [Roseivirga sp. 4D4]